MTMAHRQPYPLKDRLRTSVNGPDIHPGHYRRDAADALAEIERLEGLLRCAEQHGVGPRAETTPHAEVGPDMVNHPPHYTSHPSGIECVQITEHMGFCLGNAIKYIWRADLKGGVEDLEKARWYLDREIAKRQAAGGPHGV